MFFVRNNTLLVESAGAEFIPSADEVFRSVIEREQVWRDVPPGPVHSQVDLKFSRIAAVPELSLEMSSPSEKPKLALVYKFRDQVLETADPRYLKIGHLVAKGTWYPIDKDYALEVINILNNTGSSTGHVSSLRDFLFLKRAAKEGRIIVDHTAGINISALSFMPKSNGQPRGIDAKLYDYQLSGWQWLRFLVSERIGGLLADEMGLGKTLQVITAVFEYCERSSEPVLIVVPGSLLENWRREISKFAPKISVLKHHGASRTGRYFDLIDYDVVVTSYETVVRDLSMLLMVNWGIVVIDEAQNIKNPNAARTKAVKELKRNVAIAVTGTPVENSLLDVWSIMDFVLPGYLGNQLSFLNEFGNLIDGASRLEPHLSPLMLRRKLHDVANDLPEKIDIPQVVQLYEEEALSYEKLRESIYDEYGASATLVAIIYLRMFCCHPLLLKGDPRIDLPTANPLAFSKFQRLDEILAEIFAAGEKVIIFTSFIRMADIIVDHIENRYNVFTGCIDGRLNIDDRQPLIDIFANVEGAGVLVLNPKAGGTGLNITAANHVVHYNLQWNPALEDQASARAYRRGQELPVTVHRLISSNTVEEVINDRLVRKRKLIDASVVGITGVVDDYEDIMLALQKSPMFDEIGDKV